MSVFNLQSDNQFIRTNDGSPDIHVFEYMDDLNAFDLIHVSSSRWRSSIAVGPSAAALYKKLEVHGVTIEGSQLQELVKDLNWVDPNGRRLFPSVNRQGRCLMYVGCQQVTRVRISDHFGWSKYGVKPAQISVWPVFGMMDGAVLAVPRASPPHGHDDGDHGYFSVVCESWKKVMEEKDKVIEEKNKLVEKVESLLMRSLEEKDRVIVEKEKVMEKMEALLRKSLEEKEKEVLSLKETLMALSDEV
ncbi:unnamed protein product [Linum tenue]|uniref:Uncharacterized protein n=1 Tax=Linum tenue TaxID=586396 RepID=A0AAV0IHR9_9ROSI|nr:unnamed protein product [Linum tenue]